MTCSRRLWLCKDQPCTYAETRFYNTHVIAIRSIQVIRLFERDVRVGNDTSVMEVIVPSNMGKQTVHDEDIAFLRHDRCELLTALNVTDIARRQAGIEAFWMVVEVLNNA